MPKVTFILSDGRTKMVEAASGISVMQAAMMANIEGIVAECWGCLICATCHVYVESDHLRRLPPPISIERALLEATAAEERENSRLSCQITITPGLDGLTVRVPEKQF